MRTNVKCVGAPLLFALVRHQSRGLGQGHEWGNNYSINNNTKSFSSPAQYMSGANSPLSQRTAPKRDAASGSNTSYAAGTKPMGTATHTSHLVGDNVKADQQEWQKMNGVWKIPSEMRPDSKGTQTKAKMMQKLQDDADAETDWLRRNPVNLKTGAPAAPKGNKLREGDYGVTRRVRCHYGDKCPQEVTDDYCEANALWHSNQ